MKDITTHHDGHGLNESIWVMAIDEPGPGGAHHKYRLQIDTGGGYMRASGHIEFQNGPRNEPESEAGLTEAAVLAVLIDRLTDFRVHRRAHSRAERGVLGTSQP